MSAVDVDNLITSGKTVRNQIIGIYALFMMIAVILISTHFVSKIQDFKQGFAITVYGIVAVVLVMAFISYRRHVQRFNLWKDEVNNYIIGLPLVSVPIDTIKKDLGNSYVMTNSRNQTITLHESQLKIEYDLEEDATPYIKFSELSINFGRYKRAGKYNGQLHLPREFKLD